MINIKKILYIFLFILFIYFINRLSKSYNEDFNDFIDYDKSSLTDLIKVETERCKAIKVCGFYNGKQIPCKFTSCEDTCVCKSNPKDRKAKFQKLLNN
jgi:hypothetical protein